MVFRYLVPNWAFGLLWPTAYLLMGYAAHRVAIKQSNDCNMIEMKTNEPSLWSKFGFSYGSSTSTESNGTVDNHSVHAFLCDTRLALPVYTTQLVLSWFYQPLFFGLQQFGYSLTNIIVTASLSAWTINLFGRVDQLSGCIAGINTISLLYAAYINAFFWYCTRTPSNTRND